VTGPPARSGREGARAHARARGARSSACVAGLHRATGRGHGCGRARGPYLTLGKRGVHPDELRRRMAAGVSPHHRAPAGALQGVRRGARRPAAWRCARRGSRRCCAPAGSRRMWAGTPRRAPGTRWRSAWPKRSRTAGRRVEALRALGYVCLALGEPRREAHVISSARWRWPRPSSIKPAATRGVRGAG